MKHIKIIFVLLAVTTLMANVYGQYYAYDFSATAPSGQTLYYKIYDSTQVSVVSPYTRSGDSNYVSGDLVIPETVSYCGTTYAVTELKTHDFMIGAFFNCKSLTSVYVPNSVRYMGDYVFGYCSSLVSVHLPDSITVIPLEAFKGCSALPSITLGRCISRIQGDAFLQCWLLMEMHLQSSVAPSVGYRALWNIPDSARVYIPCGSTASYMSVQEWRQESFTFIEEPGFVIDITTSNDEYGSVEIVSGPTCDNPQTLLLATANEGYHFEGWSITPGYQNIVTDNPLAINVTSDMSIVAYFAVDSTETPYESYFGEETTVWNAVGTFSLSQMTKASLLALAWRENVVAKKPTYYDCPWENYMFHIAGDTVVNQQHYKKAEYSNIFWSAGYDERRVPGYDFLLREDRSKGRLWGRHLDEGEDFLIADMSLGIGDTFYMRDIHNPSLITCIVQDTQTVNSRRTIVLGGNTYYDEPIRFVEGIGCSNMGYLKTDYLLRGPLVCCHKDGELVYHQPVQGFPGDDCIIRAVGIDDGAQRSTSVVYVRDGRIVVEGADGETVRVFDMMGREIQKFTQSGSHALPTGVYMVRVGNSPARKVAVIRFR